MQHFGTGFHLVYGQRARNLWIFTKVRSLLFNFALTPTSQWAALDIGVLLGI
jgi:hypothetical protein